MPTTELSDAQVVRMPRAVFRIFTGVMFLLSVAAVVTILLTLVLLFHLLSGVSTMQQRQKVLEGRLRRWEQSVESSTERIEKKLDAK